MNTWLKLNHNHKNSQVMGATFSPNENDPLIRKVENLKVFMWKLKVEWEKVKEVTS